MNLSQAEFELASLQPLGYESAPQAYGMETTVKRI